MPDDFWARGDVSMVELLRESGYPATESDVSEQDIEAFLRAHPGLITDWLRYSEDQRSSAAWYFTRPGRGLDGREGWRVGYYTTGARPPERVFANEFEACAFFVMRNVEELARLANPRNL
jgi:hypothetical protein